MTAPTCGKIPSEKVPHIMHERALPISWTQAEHPDVCMGLSRDATDLPWPGLVHAFLDAGLASEHLAEGGQPTSVMLAIQPTLWSSARLGSRGGSPRRPGR